MASALHRLLLTHKMSPIYQQNSLKDDKDPELSTALFAPTHAQCFYISTYGISI